MNQKTIIIVGACVLLGLGAFFVIKTQKKPVETNTNVNLSVQTETPQAAPTASTSSAPAPTTPKPSTTKLYNNTAFGYSFAYPSSWVLEPETSVVDAQNDMPSVVSVHDTKPFSPQRFSVTINRKERTLKNEASKTEPVTIAGQTVTAYLFPDGKDCKPTKTDPDCSFFLIPIQRDGVWYEISVANEAVTLDAYRTILASFKFTK